LRKLTVDDLQHLIGAATNLFSQKEARAHLSSSVEGHLVEASSKTNERYIDAVEKVDLYAKRCGIGPYNKKRKISSYEQHIADRILQIAQKTALSPNDPYETRLSNIQAAANIGCDTISVTRNIMRSISAIGPGHPYVAFLSNWVLSLLGLAAVFSIRNAYHDYHSSSEIQDKEGVKESAQKLVENALLISGSTAWAASNIIDSVDPSLFAGVVLDHVISTAFIGAGAIGLGIAATNIYRSLDFRLSIHSFMENPHLSEKEKVQGTLQFFKDQIWLTDKEMESIKDLSSLEQKAKEKIARFRRRAGNKSVKEIIKSLTSILERLEDPKLEKEAIIEGKKLIQLVKKENLKRTIFYVLTYLAFAIGLIGSIIMAMSTFGAVPFILAAISGSIWLMLGVWGAYSYYKGRWRLDSDLAPHNIGVAFTTHS
ncbi:MAG TPA: hypothetical protein VLG44_06060, partial [Chlamydiales bacterium]|nr:hypothetical protein [Chlamydiales bacterium]